MTLNHALATIIRKRYPSEYEERLREVGDAGGAVPVAQAQRLGEGGGDADGAVPVAQAHAVAQPIPQNIYDMAQVMHGRRRHHRPRQGEHDCAHCMLHCP